MFPPYVPPDNGPWPPENKPIYIPEKPPVVEQPPVVEKPPVVEQPPVTEQPPVHNPNPFPGPQPYPTPYPWVPPDVGPSPTPGPGTEPIPQNPNPFPNEPNPVPWVNPPGTTNPWGDLAPVPNPFDQNSIYQYLAALAAAGAIAGAGIGASQLPEVVTGPLGPMGNPNIWEGWDPWIISQTFGEVYNPYIPGIH